MTRKQRRNIRQEVTNTIIAALEAGVAPWVKPWKAANGGGLPQKQDTGESYRGVNILLLMLAGMAFASNEWYTFKQAIARGGMVRKGEKGTMVVFWKLLVKTETDDDGEEVERKIPMLRHFMVFNRDQIDGFDEVEVEERPDFERHEAAEATIKSTEAKIKFGTAAAYYQPITDSIGMPFRDWFNNPETFYSTTFHELVHWSGSSDRLDRNHKGNFGSEDYAFEELVAEIGAAFLCAEHRIDGNLQHPNYIASWIKGLKNDSNAIFSAAKLAQEAADLIQEGV